MKIKTIISLFLLIGISFPFYSQTTIKDNRDTALSKIRNEGLENSQSMSMLSRLTDIYGQRLTGSQGYYNAAKWIADEMKDIGLDNVHFENYCTDCRGWNIKTFNLEMTAPNYMHITGYPMAMTKSTNGIVSGDVTLIENFKNIDSLREKFSGKIKGKVILFGTEIPKRSLADTMFYRYSEDQLTTMNEQLKAEIKTTPLPELFEKWEVQDKSDEEFLKFMEAEGVLAVLTSQPSYMGGLNADGTYYFRNNDLKPLPYFSIIPEHFNRLYRMIQLNTVPSVRLNLQTEFYNEPENNVNIIGEITGNDEDLKSEEILLGAHFDSWHSATGATDNGVNCIVLVEALRILKQIGYQPKRTIKIGLWGGEEQAFLGSAAYAEDHFGALDKTPNLESKKIQAYLNLDNGAGAIRGIYLQDNKAARSYFQNIFDPVADLTAGITTIENTLSTDHETFDYYQIPSFQFIQDKLSYDTVTHHTSLDFLEYVPEDDIKKNAVILAWTIYYLDNITDSIPRKLKEL